MDPNVPETPAAELDEFDVEFGFQPQPPPELQAPLASSIFRDAREPAYRPGGEDVQQWQEEEFQRKLRGEYEAAQRSISDVVTSSMDHPLHLSSIRIPNPPPNTRPSFLNSLISPFVSPASSRYSFLPSFISPAPPFSSSSTEEPSQRPPQTLREILVTTRTLVNHLRQFDIFYDQIDVKLEPARGGAIGDVDMVLGLRERGRLFFKGGTEIGGGEGGANATAKLRNVFGGAESLEVNAAYGTKTKSAYQAVFTTPLFASPLLTFAASAFSLDRDNSAFASHRERAQGARAKLTTHAPWGVHDLMYEYVHREIADLPSKASISVRELAHPSVKSSLVHTWTKDTRDDPWMGTSGSLLKLIHEYAGLPGGSPSAHFFKSTTQSQLSRRLWEGSSCHYSLSSLTTILIPLSSKGTPTELPDRTFLGGPNSVRGWKIGGMGRRDGPDSLGGDLAFALGLSFFAPLPYRPQWPLKLHSFINTGKVVGWHSDRTFAQNIGNLYRSPDLSVGFGLLYRLEPVRIEVNFSLPLIGRKGEGWARGLGVGLGLEFL